MPIFLSSLLLAGAFYRVTPTISPVVARINPWAAVSLPTWRIAPLDRAMRDSVVWNELRSNDGELHGKLRQLIKARIDTARTQGRTLFIEVGATWCGPCLELEKGLHSSEMIDAFAGTSIVHLDVNEWDVEKDMGPLGITGGVMPFMVAIDTTGKAVEQLAGVIDAPGLKQFFAKHRWFAGRKNSKPASPTSPTSAPKAPIAPAASVNPRLTLRPREMATGTRNPEAGEQQLDSLTDYLLYVPRQAVGTRRVPLVVFFGGGGVQPREIMNLDRQLADKYGMMLLAPNIGSMGPRISVGQVKELDVALKQVLRKFAIDPEKIALAGSSNGGYIALDVGCANLDIFSRLAPISPVPYTHPACGNSTHALGANTPVFLTAGIGETRDMVYGLLKVAQQLRDEGHVVFPVLSLRPHEMRLQDHDQAWHWLQETWAAPNGRVMPHPPAGADAIPLLTVDAIGKMTRFWVWFLTTPNAPWRTDSLVKPKEMTIPVGQDYVSVFDMVDMPTLVMKYPPIAAALTKAGLTQQQEEGDRAALISARATMTAGREAPTLKMIPRVEKNVNFIRAHQDDVNALLDAMSIPRCEVGMQEQLEPGSC